MIKFFKNSIIIRILFGLIFIYLSFIIFADPPGYCAAQQRNISDEEFIQIAVRQNKNSMNIDDSEESIRTFHAKNPDCCTVYREHTQYLSRLLLTRVHSVEVYLQFEKNTEEIARTGGSNIYYDAFVTISTCGEELENSGIGKDVYYKLPQAKKN